MNEKSDSDNFSTDTENSWAVPIESDQAQDMFVEGDIETWDVGEPNESKQEDIDIELWHLDCETGSDIHLALIWFDEKQWTDIIKKETRRQSAKQCD